MAILRQDRAPEPTLFQSDTAIWTSAESTGLTGRDLRPLTGRDLRPLDRTGRKSRARSAMPSVAAADVVILVVGYVDGRPVLMGSLILGYQPAWPGVRAVIEEEPVHVLIPRILVPVMSSGSHRRCPGRCPAPPRLATGPGTHLTPAPRSWSRTNVPSRTPGNLSRAAPCLRPVGHLSASPLMRSDQPRRRVQIWMICMPLPAASAPFLAARIRRHARKSLLPSKSIRYSA
jgi:hypothetical protein